MASILARTIFVDTRNDQVRFLDFGLVVTTLGSMVEPRSLLGYCSTSGTKAGFANIDPNNEMTKVTKIDSAEQRQKRTLFGGLQGGEQIPQEYNY